MKESTLMTLNNYMKHGWEPGGFIWSVLCNDLKGAVGKADLENYDDLKEIVMFVVWNMPGVCQGSAKMVRYWLDDEDYRNKIMEGWEKQHGPIRASTN